MPTEDQRRDGLRIGGWLESITDDDRDQTRPLVTPPPRRVPVFRPLRRTPVIRQRVLLEDPGQVRLKIAIACLAATVAGAVAVVSMMEDGQGNGPSTAARLGLADPVTMPPILSPTTAIPVVVSSPSITPLPYLPSYPVGRQVPGAGSGTGSDAGSGTSASATKAPTTKPTTTPTTTPAVELIPGTVIGLEESGRPGFRVRHRDFLGRVDPIGPSSSSTDRADSRFTVRAGGAPGCISLESVNYPGYFLRHRNFVIHLDRADNSRLFSQDSTFCPVHVAQDAIILQSINYPSRYVTENNSSLNLTQVPADLATGFVAKAPL